MSKRQRGKREGRVGALYGSGRPYPLAFRMRVVDEVLSGIVSIDEAARVFGPSPTTVSNWLALYEQGGEEALRPQPTGPAPRPPTHAQQVRRQAVLTARSADPTPGSRRIRDVLARFSALGVSETEVRRILHEEGLMSETPARTEAREHPPRRFERAAPNQLWQSDIFTFLLRRHERLYLAAFMDDHSRFLVSHALAHHQRAPLVLEALSRAVADFGTPEEVLTDQGRQYTAWRGETSFEQELRRQGIRHVKSRPQHPQTLGKIERFWKTLWEEFLSRTVFSDFDDCARRLVLFVQAYNFQRPHQGIEGLVPADRFFRAAAHVRAAIEKSVADNALRMSLEQPPRKPFYLVGRLGDRDLSISTTGAGVQVRFGDEEPQTIAIASKEQDHEQEDRRHQAQATPLDARAH